MNPKRISALLAQLESLVPSTRVANPYLSEACSTNLSAYLSALCALPFSGHLLIGEAPGHRGCALTGIPFTSQRVLKSSRHPFVIDLRPALDLSGDLTEATATIVWRHLESCTAVPALWNIFPFHPHEPNDLSSNRHPNQAEVATGLPFFQLVVEILSPNTIIAVGGTAGQALARFLPDLNILTVRHPSRGGKADFISGITEAGVRPDPKLERQ